MTLSQKLLSTLTCALFAAVPIHAEEPNPNEPAVTQPEHADPEHTDPASELAEPGHPNPFVRYFGAQVDAARDEKKTLLLAIYNTDEPSALSKVLIGTPEWKERVVGKYLIMPLNLSSRLLADPQYAAMAADIGAKYPTKNIPGMIFLDENLLPVAQIHSKTTKEDFLAALDKVEAALATRAELNNKLAAHKIENAKLLDQVVESALSQDAPAEALRGQIDDIIALDADNKAGLKSKYKPMAQILDAQFLMSHNNPAAAESILIACDASKSHIGWQELRYSLLLDAVQSSSDAARIEATLNEALKLEGAKKETRQVWYARAAAAVGAQGDNKRAEEWMKKALEADPESAWAKAAAAPAVATAANEAATPAAATKRPISTHDGKPFDLDSLKGKVVVIEFWSHANRHSPLALQTLSDIAAQYKETNKDTVFIAVNVGNSDDCEDHAAKIKNLTWIDDATGILEDRFDVKRAPLTVLVDKEGKKAGSTTGLNPFNKAVLESKLKDLLK